MFIVRTMSRWLELFGESQPSATLTPFARSSGIRPCSGTPRPLLAAVTGHITTPVRVRAMQSISAVVDAEHVREEHVRPEHAEGFEVFGRPDGRDGRGYSWLALGPLLWWSVSDVPRSSATRLQRLQELGAAGVRENGIAQARMRPWSRPCHFSMNAAVRATASRVG